MFGEGTFVVVLSFKIHEKNDCDNYTMFYNDKFLNNGVHLTCLAYAHTSLSIYSMTGCIVLRLPC